MTTAVISQPTTLQRLDSYLNCWTTTITMWGFAALSGALVARACFQSLADPTRAFSVFGGAGAGYVPAWGLTFGGPSQDVFSTMPMFSGMSGLEGPLLALGLLMVLLLGALVSLIPGRGARTIGAVTILLWALLWLTNAARLAAFERDLGLAAIACVLLFVAVCCARRVQAAMNSI